jgi:hypothetical protein
MLIRLDKSNHLSACNAYHVDYQDTTCIEYTPFSFSFFFYKAHTARLSRLAAILDKRNGVKTLVLLE